MNVLAPKRVLLALLAAILSLGASAQTAPAPAVRVTVQLDATNLKVGDSTTAHVMAEIVPGQKATTDQIFAWYVDLLDSAPSAIQIDATSVVVPTSDSDPNTSSKGTLSSGSLRAVYNTFLQTAGAGHDAPIELFSVKVKAVAVGAATLTVSPGTTAPALSEDFIVSTPSGNPIYGGLYDTAKAVITSFNNVPPTIDPVDPITVNEGNLVSFTATAHDTDVGQTLRFSLVGAVPLGANIDAVTGVFTWTPSENQGPENYTLKIRVSDSGSPVMTATNQFSIVVNEVNTAPSLQVPGTMNMVELHPITATCTATDSDVLANRTPTTNRLTFSLIDPPDGATINPATGAFSWTPTEAQGPNGYLIKVQVVDDGVPALATTKTFTINVAEENRAPTIASPGDQTIAEGATMNVAFVASDPDLPANALSFSLISAPPGVVLDPATGVVSWTPTEAQGPNTYTIKVAVSDNAPAPLFATNTMQVNVTEVNAAPTLGQLLDRSVDELTTLSFTVGATDTDLPAQTLTFSLDNPPVGAGINPTTGAFSWTPTEAQGPNKYTIIVRVTDSGTPSRSDTRTFDVTVNEKNVAPILTTPVGMDDQTVPELAPLSIQFTASDSDLPANLISFSLSGAPTGAAIEAASGLFTWTPSEAQGPGSYTFKVIATDNGVPPLATTNTIHIAVTEANTIPLINPIDTQRVDELSKLTFTVTATDPDLPAQSITFSLDNPPAGASIDSTTGVFTWTPSESQGPGQFTLTIRARDNGTPALSVTRAFVVIVNEVNTAPVVQAFTPITAAEQTAISAQAIVTDSDILTGQVPATNRFTFTLINPPSGATIDPQTGVFSWTPTEAQGPLQYQIKVVATDDGIPPLSGTNTLTINVTEANRAPSIIAPADPAPVAELSTLNLTFTATDPDIPANTLTFFLVQGPQGVQVNPTSGVLTWTPTEAQGPGTYAIKVAVSDNANPPLFATNTVNVSVTEVNVGPTLNVIGDKTIPELSTFTFTPIATDPDLPAQTLVYSLDAAPTGASIDPASGLFSWRPTEAQGPGQFTVTVRVAESGVGGLFDTKTFKINVTEVNSAPTVQAPGNQFRPELSPITLTFTATDTDILNNATPNTNRYTFSLLNPPNGASIDPVTGVFAWTPTEAQGPNSYTIQVVATDDGVPPLSGTNSMVLNVTEVNRAPSITAPPDQSVHETSQLTAAFLATDPDLPANTLTFSLVSGPSGAVVNPTTGVLTWTPTEAQGPGTYAIKVAVTDNGSPALSANASVNITVVEVNSAPTLAALSDRTIAAGATLTFTATATDSDLPAQTLIYSLDSAPTGAAIDPSTGVFTWTPTAAQAPRDYSLIVRASESGPNGLFDTKSFKITVTPPNPQPTIKIISVLPEGVNLRLDGDANATYTIEYSTDLISWSSLKVLSLGSQTFVTYLDAAHNLVQQRGFYRAKVGGVLNPTAPTVRVISVDPTGYSLRVLGDVGVIYRIEFSTDLKTWTSVTPITILPGGSTDYLDTLQSTRGRVGYYRAAFP